MSVAYFVKLGTKFCTRQELRTQFHNNFLGIGFELAEHEKTDQLKPPSMSQNDMDEITTEWGTKLEGGAMDKRNAVLRQLIE